MNIFVETNYRQLVLNLVQERKSRGDAITLGGLAKAAQMQKAHMTNVLKGRAQFQADQMFLIAQALQLSLDERQYLLLLLEVERTVVELRRRQLKAEIESLQRKYLSTEVHLSAEKLEGQSVDKVFPEYYLEPIHQVVHLAIAIESLSRDLGALARALNLPLPRLEMILERLILHGLVEHRKGRYVNLRRNLHLKRTSPLFRAWRQQSNSLFMARLQSAAAEEHYGFSAVFSADEKTRRRMHAKILDLIRSFESDVRSAPSKNVYQVSIDLMPWTSIADG